MDAKLLKALGIGVLQDFPFNRHFDVEETKKTRTGRWLLEQYSEWPTYFNPEGKLFVYDDGRPIMQTMPVEPFSEEVSVSVRPGLLYLSTHSEKTELEEAISGQTPDRRFEPLFAACGEYDISTSEILCCTHMMNFWESFFGTELYLDVPDLTKPTVMVTTGAMRNYRWDGGETVEVADRLKELASRWDVPFIRLQGFDHGFRAGITPCDLYRKNPALPELPLLQ